MATKEQMGQIRALEQRWKDKAPARRGAAMMSEFAEGNWRHKIPKMPSEPDAHAASKRPFAPLILGWALRQLTYLYDRPPVRELETDQEREWAAESLWRFGQGLDSAMSSADWLSRLHGACLVSLAYKYSSDSASDVRAWLRGEEPAQVYGTDGVEATTVARSLYEGLPNEMDPRHLEAVAILIGTDEEGKEMHHYWTRTEFAVLIDWQPQPIGDEQEEVIAHGIGDLPFVLVRNTEHAHGLDAVPTGGRDLMSNLLQVGSLWREYGWTAKLQRGQPWATGKVTSLTLAPDALVEMDEGGTFGIAGNAANMAGMRLAVQDHMGAIAQSMGLPPRAFRVDIQSSQSGIAIALDRAELEDDRLSREKIFKVSERTLHRRAALVYSSATGASQLAVLLGITYRPRPQLMSTDEALKRVIFLRGEGLISDHDTVSEAYPDKTPAEVDAWLERAEADRIKRLGEVETSADKATAREVEVVKATAPADPFAGLLGGT